MANYGASLQALALQTFLKKSGHDAGIIDYVPEYCKSYRIWDVHPSSHLYKLSKYFFIVKLFCAIRSYLQMRPTLKRKEAFEQFTNKYLCLTEHYDSYAQLVANPPEADVYLAGSDQIWRTNLNNGKDPAFFLQFGDDKVRRVSYAASFGIPYLTDGMDRLVRLFLSTFNAISVREKSGMAILDGLGLKGTLVCDPVFLLTREEWISILDIKERKIKEPYVLVYDLNRGIMHDEKKSFVEQYARSKGLRTVAINDARKTPYVDININDGSPVDFVNLIVNADFVVSDSFHATAFCCIMHTPFKVFYESPQAVRIADFLSVVGLSDRMNTGPANGDIDWDDVDRRLVSYITDSKSYLMSSLKE